MNEVGFRFQELSLGQVKAPDCGNSLGPILAKNSRKTAEKSKFFPWAGVENPTGAAVEMSFGTVRTDQQR